MVRSLTPAVLDALDATAGDEYGTALAAVLALAGPAADELARRRDALVERLLVELSFRLYLDPGARLSPHERIVLLDHLARRPRLADRPLIAA